MVDRASRVHFDSGTIRSTRVPNMAETSQSSSPLDRFLVEFLTMVSASDAGFQPGPESATLATRMDTPQAFVDALFTSARTRGLLKPKYGRGNKIRWTVSPAGEAFLLRHVS